MLLHFGKNTFFFTSLKEIYRIKLPGSAKIGEGKPETSEPFGNTSFLLLHHLNQLVLYVVRYAEV